MHDRHSQSSEAQVGREMSVACRAAYRSPPGREEGHSPLSQPVATWFHMAGQSVVGLLDLRREG
jgi:hypothetical protein